MNSYIKQIKAVIRATRICSSISYSWFGKLSHPLSRTLKRVFTPEAARSYLLFNLQGQIYDDFYCQGYATLPNQELVGTPLVGIMPFVRELSTANTGTGCWENGWLIRRFEEDKAVLFKEGLELWVHAEECKLAPDKSSMPMTASLRLPKELLNFSPGFYIALSDKEFNEDKSQTLVRLYWNLTSEGAVHFVRSVTSKLNKNGLPFKLKIVNDPLRYTRCDVAILYIHKTDYLIIGQILAKLYPKVSKYLKNSVPALTKPLAPGIGLAEDPEQGLSFGMHRSKLLADGIIRAYEQGKKSLHERLQVVEERFAEDGIDLEKPYLNPGSVDDYSFQSQDIRRLWQSHDTAPISEIVNTPASFLETADEIGWHLSQKAVWHSDRCTWLGATFQEYNYGIPQTGFTYKPLGPELYSGTSGIALFLAELYALSGDITTRRTAIGATRQAIAHYKSIPRSSHLGLYAGWMGIALSCARLGIILRAEEFLERAKQLLPNWTTETYTECDFDLISGSAGAIAALVVLHYILNDSSLLDFAAHLGDGLLGAVDKSDGGYSWRLPAFPYHRNLTGFSHGTAGIGYALLELFNVTHERKYRDAAEQAFAYEQYWFNDHEGNWPDFREQTGQGKRHKSSLSFATYWCHGAPGISLSRLRAYSLLKEEIYKTEALRGLQTTCAMIEKTIRFGGGNFSLCHGLAGNAEVLLTSYQVLGQEAESNLVLAHIVAKEGITRYAAHDHCWPCGSNFGETPSLMLGLAGIGHFYLRLHKPAIPSILILQRENFSRT
jgi:hypothetical protein